MARLWWVSQDEERWPSNAATREAAIELGRVEYDGEEFLIVEAEIGTLDFSIHPSDYWEMIDRANEEKLDPDGDSGIGDRVSKEAAEDLKAALNETIANWIVRNNIDTKAWAFDYMGTVETIPAVEVE